ncbi:MAG: hypothetical protein HY210_05545 [Candidatus Omnitrophica bacterium]|nr:hypothetical protein [Candidatus Omnitrophota bacterium]
MITGPWTLDPGPFFISPKDQRVIIERPARLLGNKDKDDRHGNHADPSAEPGLEMRRLIAPRGLRLYRGGARGFRPRGDDVRNPQIVQPFVHYVRASVSG